MINNELLYGCENTWCKPPTCKYVCVGSGNKTCEGSYDNNSYIFQWRGSVESPQCTQVYLCLKLNILSISYKVWQMQQGWWQMPFYSWCWQSGYTNLYEVLEGLMHDSTCLLTFKVCLYIGLPCT
jgi:hypothetical protein